MGIAVWLVPLASETELLKQLMRVPPSLEPLSYALPCFEPHITIASFPSTTPLERLRTALENTRIGPVHLTFSALSVGDAYFRSVLLDVAPTPALNALREEVKKALPEYEARSPRFPHVSLFYVPDEQEADRERIKEAVWDTYGFGRDLDDDNKSDLTRIAFDLADADAGSGRRRHFKGFDASEVWIVRCDEPVDEWAVLERIYLVQHLA